MSKTVLISYSSANKDFAEYLNVKLKLAGIPTLFDYDFVDGGERVLNSLNEMISRATVLICVLSPSAIASKWVRYELSLFESRKAVEPELLLIPVLLEGCELPSSIPNYMVLDFSSGIDQEYMTAELVTRIKNSNHEEKKNEFISTTMPGHKRKELENVVKVAVDKGMETLRGELKTIVTMFQKQQYLMTPQSIAMRERDAINDIWIVTTHLYNDTQDEEFYHSVVSNFKRDVMYTYFVDETDLIKKRRLKYEKLYGKHSSLYRFITLRAGVFLPFDEVVIYEPNEPARCWGYAQMKYPIPGSPGDDLFLRLPGTNAIHNARALQIILDQESKGENK